ncbi:MAG: tetratricopeptide repeat protein [Alphaproteobacteria bacterium]|nr:tetratricopeptide repeat protein [Alphaproteobacteria bacterium]
MTTIVEALTAGVAHFRAGRLDRAEQVYRQVLAFDPEQPDALRLLGMLLDARGDSAGAMAALERSCALDPARVEARLAAGIAAQRQGGSHRAERHIWSALGLAPDMAGAHVELANLLAKGQRRAEAIGHLGHAIALEPACALWRHKRAALHQADGRLDAAVVDFARGVALDPADAVARYNLGTLHYQRRHLAEAALALAGAASLAPDHVEAHFNRGIVALNSGQLALAEACLQQALNLRPDYAEAWNSLGAAIQGQGRLEQSLACFRRALEIKPDYHECYSNLLFFMNYLPDVTDADHARENRRWAAVLERAMPPALELDNDPDPDRRLRLGFVSPEFSREQNYMAFFEAVLANHDRNAFDIYCYGDVAAPDETTRRVASLARVWRDIHGMDNRQRAELIRGDRIDVLVNLCGWLPLHRALFAQRMAPVQLAYINHVSTTGLANMDYRISDRWIDPPGRTEAFNTETLYRLETGYACYTPPADAPDVDALPASRNGHVTFGSFNYLTKVTPEVVALWAEILRAVPSAGLLMKAITLSDGAARQRYRSLFAGHGIDPDRIEMVGRVPDSRDNLRVIQRADIALDPFPFNGGKSTCDVLWMGVPVIAYSGSSMIARVASSMISRANLPELVGADRAGYRDIAVALAGDLPRLAKLRAGMRARLRGSPLFDMVGHTRELDRAYREMWRRWCTRLR